MFDRSSPLAQHQPTHRTALAGAGSGLLVGVVGLLVEGARWLGGLPHGAPIFWDGWQAPAIWVGACIALGVAVSLASNRWRSRSAFFAWPAVAGATLGVLFLILDRGADLITVSAAAIAMLVGGALGALGAVWWRHAS